MWITSLMSSGQNQNLLNDMKKYVLDCIVVPNMWPLKICTNLSKEEVLAHEDARL